MLVFLEILRIYKRKPPLIITSLNTCSYISKNSISFLCRINSLNLSNSCVKVLKVKAFVEYVYVFRTMLFLSVLFSVGIPTDLLCDSHYYHGLIKCTDALTQFSGPYLKYFWIKFPAAPDRLCCLKAAFVFFNLLLQFAG